jgi:release factor glutamine methyltransferase
VRVVVLPGVLRPPSDCRLLASVVRELGLARGASVLDVFTGSGALALVAAQAGAESVTATDIARWAVFNVKVNGLINRTRVRVLRGDLFEPVRAERFDLILANPPYLPGEIAEVPRRGRARAWEAGLDGRALVDRLCHEAVEHLAPGGNLLVVHSSLCDEEATLSRLRARGLRSTVLARRRGPLGPIAAARARALERRGLIAPGERVEDILVILAANDGHARRGTDASGRQRGR